MGGQVTVGLRIDSDKPCHQIQLVESQISAPEIEPHPSNRLWTNPSDCAPKISMAGLTSRCPLVL